MTDHSNKGPTLNIWVIPWAQ